MFVNGAQRTNTWCRHPLGAHRRHRRRRWSASGSRSWISTPRKPRLAPDCYDSVLSAEHGQGNGGLRWQGVTCKRLSKRCRRCVMLNFASPCVPSAAYGCVTTDPRRVRGGGGGRRQRHCRCVSLQFVGLLARLRVGVQGWWSTARLVTQSLAAVPVTAMALTGVFKSDNPPAPYSPHYKSSANLEIKPT